MVEEWIASVLWTLYWLFILFVFFRLLLSNRPPEILFAWSIVLFLLPGVGFLLFVLFGADWKHRRIMKRLPEDCAKERDPEQLKRQAQSIQLSLADTESLNDAQKMMHTLLNTSNAPVTLFNEARFYFNGTDYFEALLQAVERASYSVYMQFYIWRSDTLGNRLLTALCQKAKEGVEVCLLFDGVGCLFKISPAYKRRLAAAGIRFRFFMNPSLVTLPFLNYRNHRKLAVIDDSVCFCGGFNVGDEYVDGGKRFEAWRDTGVRVRGELLPYLKDIFEVSWIHSQGGALKPSLKPLQIGTATVMQVAASGPDSKWNSIEVLLMTMVANANKRVLIQSPYLILDSAFSQVLQNAALSGIEVQVMIAAVPDKHIPYWVAETYFEPLVRSGVQVYRYQKGFLHAKMVVVDDYAATLGSCNCDIRSFKLAYENNIVIYDEAQVALLRTQFEEDLRHCRLIDKENLSRYPLWRRFRNSVFRLLAPIL